MKVECFDDENDTKSESGGRLVVVLHRHSNGYRRFYYPLALVFFPLGTYLPRYSTTSPQKKHSRLFVVANNVG